MDSFTLLEWCVPVGLVTGFALGIYRQKDAKLVGRINKAKNFGSSLIIGCVAIMFTFDVAVPEEIMHRFMETFLMWLCIPSSIGALSLGYGLSLDILDQDEKDPL